MKKIDGGRLLTKALKKEGVEQIFTLSGGHIMSIFYACREEGIELIDVRHEVNAMYAANAYAQVTGKTGIVVTTAGPGVTNTFTGMIEALSKRVPVIQIGGASFLEESDTGALQEFDTVEAMRPVSKWARRVVHTHRIPEYVAMAFRQANDTIPGPVYLEIPSDILYQSVNEEEVYFPELYRTEAQVLGDPNLVKQAAELLSEAKRPAMVIGSEVRFNAKEIEAVKELVNYLNIPVQCTGFARGLFADESDPIWKMGNIAVTEADVILTLNLEMDFRVKKGAIFNPDARIIQVHPDKTKIGYNVPAHIGIIGAGTAVAKQILEVVHTLTPKKQNNEWIERVSHLAKAAVEPLLDDLNSELVPIHPARLVNEVNKFLQEEGRDWNLVIDGGDSGAWMNSTSIAHRPGQIFLTGPMGTIGTGAGTTLGAWIANKKPVLYFTGDGSFGYYPMEFDTFERQGIPVVCVISNDSAWGMVKLADPELFPEEVKEGFVGTDLAYLRRYDKLPEAWGGYGELVKDPKEIIPAIKRAAATGKPSIINVEVGMYNMHIATKTYADDFAKYQK